MMNFISRLFVGCKPAFSEARPADAAAISVIHGASFQRGWGEDEIYRLLTAGNVLAHRAMNGSELIGFIFSRRAAGEAEILSVAIAPAWRGRKLSRSLLDLHMRRLAGIGVRSLFLEVGEHNGPALRLYRRAGFREVSRRQGYYEGGATALVLRRDLA